MKKFFTLTLVFSALFFCVQGQISKGSKLLGGYFSAYQLSGNYGINVEEYSGNKSNYTSWGASYSFTPGIFYRFTESFMGEANIGGVGVGYNQADNGGIYKMWGIGASFLSSFGLGLNFIL